MCITILMLEIGLLFICLSKFSWINGKFWITKSYLFISFNQNRYGTRVTNKISSYMYMHHTFIYYD
jgi:hypothetical protein